MAGTGHRVNTSRSRVYARVLSGGMVRQGDPVLILDGWISRYRSWLPAWTRFSCPGVAWSVPFKVIWPRAAAALSGGKMRSLRMFALIPAAILALACGRDDSSRRVDDALNADLSLAAQARPYTALDSISALERLYAEQGLAPGAYAPAPVRRTSSTPVRRTSTASRSSSGTYSAPAPRRPVIVKKNTKRDAVIGGVAGAAIGAATSRDKVKGAVIGGVTGAIIGGVIGNNVDVERR